MKPKLPIYRFYIYIAMIYNDKLNLKLNIMKKLVTLILTMGIGLSSFSQAINDQAVIPVSVTLNSIMRIQVTSGGNMEFVFSSIDSYTSGIGPSARYVTVFSVASSVDFDVTLDTESTDFIGEGTGASLLLDAVDFQLTGGVAGTNTLLHATQLPLVDGEDIIVPLTNNGGQGHIFTMNWQCGVTKDIVSYNVGPDRYSNNIFLTLTKH